MINKCIHVSHYILLYGPLLNWEDLLLFSLLCLLS